MFSLSTVSNLLKTSRSQSSKRDPLSLSPSYLFRLLLNKYIITGDRIQSCSWYTVVPIPHTLCMRNAFQDLRWMPETADITGSYIHYDFSYTYIPMIKFNLLISHSIILTGDFLVAQTVKHLPTMWEIRVQPLGRKDPLEKAMAPHSSILALKIPWTEQPGRLQSMGSHIVGHD